MSRSSIRIRFQELTLKQVLVELERKLDKTDIIWDLEHFYIKPLKNSIASVSVSF